MRFILTRLGVGELSNDPIVKTLSLATLVSTFGNGLFMTVELIYFSLIVGLTAGELAIGLGAAGLVALVATVPAGTLADRFGARRVEVVAHLLEAAGFFILIFIDDFLGFLLVNLYISLVSTIGHTSNTALISKMGVGDDRVNIRAAQRAMANMGIGFGTLLAGIALSVNIAIVYQSLMAVNGLTFLLASWIIYTLPASLASERIEGAFSLVALKDKRYLAATVLNAIMTMHFVIQSVALPLWVVQYTDAPKWIVSILFLINTVMVTVLQVRFSKGGGDITTSVRKFRVSGYYLMGACVVYSLATGMPAWASIVFLVAGMIIHSIGELLTAAGGWSIGFELADESRQGQYQGVYGLGWGMAGTLGPLYVTGLAIGLGVLGWWIMGAIFLIAGLLMKPVVEKISGHR